MRKFTTRCLAGAGLFVIAAAIAAPTVAAAEEETALQEIVVTARRQSENLQDVPQTVNAVTAEELQKLNVTRFQDIQRLVPGLALGAAGNSFENVISLRGLSFTSISNGTSNVAFYLNEAPVSQDFLFTSLYDPGQVEVLQGPQGTARGQSAPSGAITVTTRRADTQGYGGFLDFTGANHNSLQLRAGVNVPIIRDVLAVRLAAARDTNEINGIHSVNNPTRPRQDANSIRASVTYTPNDWFSAHLMYQRNRQFNRFYTQVYGAGRGYNGPVIQPFDRLAVGENPSRVIDHGEIAVGEFEVTRWSHRLTYIVAWAKRTTHQETAFDAGNSYLGGDTFQSYFGNNMPHGTFSHELRLASIPGPERRFDYTVGVFYNRNKTNNDITQPAAALPGAFGSPAAPTAIPVLNPKFVLPLFLSTPGLDEELSVFGSVTAHVDSKTELTFGGRYIDYHRRQIYLGQTQAAYLALPPSFVGLPSCGALGLGSTYPGFCDLPTLIFGPKPAIVLNFPKASTHSPFLYSASLSRHFTPDLMVYVNTGTAWRRPAGSVGLNNSRNDPVLNDLIYGKPEKSTSYEAGFKWTFLDRRARLNVAIYRQKFKGLIYRPSVSYPYLSDNGVQVTVNDAAQFTVSADGIVQGFAIDTEFQVTSKLNTTFSVAYNDGHLSNAMAPCRDANFDGKPDLGTPTLADFARAGVVVAQCRSSGTVIFEPYWTANATAEYVTPVTAGVEGFVRGLFTYYPKNSRRSAGFVVDNYSLANLFAGIRSEDRTWEVTLYAKNAFKTDKVLSKSLNTIVEASVSVPAAFQNSNYYRITTTPRREVGVNIRYAFGTR